MRILIAGFLMASAGLVMAGDEMPEKAAQCAACHGEAGAKPILPEYPVLAGQYAHYLEHAMREYRDGKRSNAVMSGQAAGLSDAEIADLAAYFQAQESPLYTPGLPAGAAE